MLYYTKQGGDGMPGCHGADGLKTPELKIKICPECGAEVEMFSTDIEIQCERCGYTVYNDIQSCVQWCKYAIQCVGEELYNKLISAAKKTEK